LLPSIVSALEHSVNLVLEAPPGAGKTTRVPPALLAHLSGGGEIVVLQPRRLPARLAAERVAEERGEEVGQTVGYTVRFEEVAGPRTRLRFMTEGILLRRLLADPVLRGVSVVILDEFHERHLATDLALALLRRLQRTQRPDLRLVVMSATLDGEPVREFLGDCESLRSEGRSYPVGVDYLDAPDDRPLGERIASAVRRVHQEGEGGDVLVFLPGAGEIRRAAEALELFARTQNLLVLPLHGDLSPADQHRAVTPAGRPKVILSTNVAETSVTIDGVVAVIDSGLARIASHSPWSGLPRLAVAKISQASAIQRAGRAGRTRPGRALRLYARHDFESRRPFELPEVARLDLSEAVLTLAGMGVRAANRFEWFEAPGAAALQAAVALLQRLGAIDAREGLTETGRHMLRFPAHPRLARLLVEGERRGAGEDAAALAGLLSQGDIADDARARFGDARNRRQGAVESADLLERLDRFAQARAARFDRGRLRGLGVDARAAESADKARRQFAGALRREARPEGRSKSASPSPDEADAVLAMATLTAFPDRVMRRRSPGANQAILSTGGAAEIGPLPDSELLVAVDAEERQSTSGRSLAVRLAVAVREDWLLDLVPDGLSESEETLWNANTERVETVEKLCYGAVVLHETRRQATPSSEASRILADAALAARAKEGEVAYGSAVELQAKLEILRKAFPEQEIPTLEAEHVGALVAQACAGLVSLAELRATPIEERLRQALSPVVVGLLRGETPDRVQLPGGRSSVIHYQPDRLPWIESRLQDFFGMRSSPAICRGRIPLTLHLLAPNHRAVQVTSDLAGFWQNHYPAIRRELCRRYPRHAWPEDGATATPPPPRPRR
jgi:ATP-dependent helicase HrpB